MERRAKERLIGAAILVVLIVLIVPELLSGPKPEPVAAKLPQLPAAASSPEPTRTVTVDLATSKAPAVVDSEVGTLAASAPPAASATAASALPEREADNDPAPATAGAPTAGATVGAPPVVMPQPAPAPVESALQSPISEPGTAHGKVAHTGGWAVQLGSFASHDNADKLVHQLKTQGFAAYMLSGGSGTATRHRVRVGPFADRDNAERAAAKLKALGHTSSLVPP